MKQFFRSLVPRGPRGSSQEVETSDPPETLCESCRSLDLEKAFNWRLTKDQAAILGAIFHDADDEDNHRLIIADVLHNLLQTMESCPLCLLVFSALQNQYIPKDKELWANEPYCLRWLYVSTKVNRCDEFNGEFVRYIEVLSSANCDADRLREGLFKFENQITKKSVRSLIAPLVPNGVKDTDAPTMWARFVPPRIDPHRVKQWMRSCDEWHGSECGEGSDGIVKELPSTSFSVIDVENMCIVCPSEFCRYITLSYTWGSNGENSFLALRKNIAQLRAPYGLEKHMKSLPTTIQDAIAFTKSLEERYLWVDSLCIIQDDDENKEANITTMASVYENATLTLIAATGDNANAGLPGIRESSRNWKQRACCGDKGLFTVVDDLEMALHKSAWITRGWTYQEWFFSDRCLIFVGGQVIFSCRKATWREDIHAERKPSSELFPLNAIDLSYVSIDYELRPSRQLGIKFDATMDFNMVLSHTLRDYLGRRLTYDTDILNAFSGVLQSFSRSLESTVIMGSIARILDWSLGFELNTRGDRRKEFPSWTWCGWKGAPLWGGANEGLFEWTRESTWILWHHRGIEPETITEIPRETYIKWDDSVEAQAARLDISEAEDNEMPFAARMLYHQFKFKRPTKATLFRLPKSPLEHPNIAKHRGYLQFWTMAAPLAFEYPTKIGKISLFDSDNDGCGTLYVDQALDASKPHRKCEIILLSQNNWCLGVQTYLSKKVPRDKGKGKSASSGEGPKINRSIEKSGKPVQNREILDGMLYVMLIAWDSGIAERIGIGQIWTESVHYLADPGLEWKEFVLS